jgi:hypothetical protein
VQSSKLFIVRAKRFDFTQRKLRGVENTLSLIMGKEGESGWGEKLQEWVVPAGIIAGLLGLVAIIAA